MSLSDPQTQDGQAPVTDLDINPHISPKKVSEEMPEQCCTVKECQKVKLQSFILLES